MRRHGKLSGGVARLTEREVREPARHRAVAASGRVEKATAHSAVLFAGDVVVAAPHGGVITRGPVAVAAGRHRVVTVAAIVVAAAHRGAFATRHVADPAADRRKLAADFIAQPAGNHREVALGHIEFAAGHGGPEVARRVALATGDGSRVALDAVVPAATDRGVGPVSAIVAPARDGRILVARPVAVAARDGCAHRAVGDHIVRAAHHVRRGRGDLQPHRDGLPAAQAIGIRCQHAAGGRTRRQLERTGPHGPSHIECGLWIVESDTHPAVGTNQELVFSRAGKSTTGIVRPDEGAVVQRAGKLPGREAGKSRGRVVNPTGDDGIMSGRVI